MAKKDIVISLVISFLIGLFFFIAVKALQPQIPFDQIPFDWLIIVVFPPLTLLGLFVAEAIGKKFLAAFQLAKFLLVGALNTFIDLGVLNFLMWLFGIYAGAPFAVFKGISFLLAATNSYFWNKHWTFEKRNGAFKREEYFKFLVIVAIGLFVNIGMAALVVNVVEPRFGISENLWANIGAFLAVFASIIWNFIGSKFIVFRA